jgi:hypothetical protein
MVEPAAPIVPGDEDRCFVPEPASNDRLDLVDGPMHAVGNVLHGMLAKVRSAVAIDPGYCRQPAGRRIMQEQITGVVTAVTVELVDVMKRVVRNYPIEVQRAPAALAMMGGCSSGLAWDCIDAADY